jgi:hypothetical protein
MAGMAAPACPEPCDGSGQGCRGRRSNPPASRGAALPSLDGHAGRQIGFGEALRGPALDRLGAAVPGAGDRACGRLDALAGRDLQEGLAHAPGKEGPRATFRSLLAATGAPRSTTEPISSMTSRLRMLWIERPPQAPTSSRVSRRSISRAERRWETCWRM